MKTITESLSKDRIRYDLSLLGRPEDILFLDIETTGFAARSSQLYMIGCVDFDSEANPRIIQFFAEEANDEKQILSAFLNLCSSKKVLIHYNGNNFDIPYLKQKCFSFGFDEPFSKMDGVDIYKRIMPYKRILGVENLKQKTMEQFLSISREDAYNGGELINVYRDYVAQNALCKKLSGIKNTDSKELAALDARIKDMAELLFLHNADDMRGMLSLLSLLAYADIFLQPSKITKVSARKLTDPDGSIHQTLVIRLRLTSSLPRELTINTGNIRLLGSDNEITLDISIYSGELKYFYGNYKDYYYLPDEDMALHKSVAAYVSPDHRTQATAHDCYTRKEGSFLPQWELLFEPVFKHSYEDSLLYFELTPELKKRPDQFKKYADHVLDYLFHSLSESKNAPSKQMR